MSQSTIELQWIAQSLKQKRGTQTLRHTLVRFTTRTVWAATPGGAQHVSHVHSINRTVPYVRLLRQIAFPPNFASLFFLLARSIQSAT